MAFSFDLGLAISAERYGAISAGPEQEHTETVETRALKSNCFGEKRAINTYKNCREPI